jgi:hypothetical protein
VESFKITSSTLPFRIRKYPNLNKENFQGSRAEGYGSAGSARM